MQAIDQNRFLRSTHIADLYRDHSKVKLLRRLHKLYHNGYLDRPLAQLDYYQRGGGSKPLVYGITSKGSALIASKQGRGARRIENRASRVFLDHTLAVADFMVALERSASARSGVRVIYPDEILKRASAARRGKHSPLSWETRITWRGTPTSIWVVPDKMFGLSFSGRPRETKYFFLEADRGTMPVVRTDLRRTSFLRKFLSYAATYRDKLHRKRFGMGNFRVLTVTTSKARIDSLTTAYREYIPDVPPNVFLFADHGRVQAADDLLSLSWTNGKGSAVSLLPKFPER